MDDYDDFAPSEPPRDAVIDAALPRVMQGFEASPGRVYDSNLEPEA
jgi:hypothetical protein